MNYKFILHFLIFVGEIVGEIFFLWKQLQKVWLYNKREKKNGRFPVKIRVIWQRKFYFYQTGVDLTEDEFKNYHKRKDLRKQFDDIIYYLNKADKIVKDLERNFHGRNLTHFITIVNQQAIKSIINLNQLILLPT